MSSQRRNYRFILVVTLFVLASLAVSGRLVYLQVHDHEFLAGQGDLRSIRDLPIPVTRGMITDRNGEPLAVSTEVASIWCNPREMAAHLDEVPRLAGALHRPAAPLLAQLQANPNKRFLYLERGLSPIEASEVMALGITGVHQIKEYKRFYPSSELTAQLIGLVNIDGRGQEGTELGFNDWLSGKDGVREVAINPRGSLVNSIKVLKTPKASQDVALSIDLRLQFIAYKALEKAVLKFGAHSGSAVLVNPKSGQILAMANFPSYNPNNRASFAPAFMRNRTLTDTFEPGSVIKPFSMSAALASGKFDENSQVSVAPGWMTIDGHTIHDVARRDVLTMTGVLINSSNIGMSKVALQIGPKPILEQLGRVGFGAPLSLGFPGENPGYLPFHEKWSNIATASMSFGYSLAVNTAELAQAYSVFANDGKLVPLSLLRDNPQNQAPGDGPADRTAHPGDAANRGGRPEGRGPRPRAGLPRGGQERHRAQGLGPGLRGQVLPFAVRRHGAGVRPATGAGGDDRFANGIGYFGGLVSAPTFSDIMAGSLRALAIPPDNLQDSPAVADRQHHG